MKLHLPSRNKTIFFLELFVLIVFSTFFILFQDRLLEKMNTYSTLMNEECLSINTVPINITSPGNYCLSQDFKTNVTAITIRSDNVNIDFKGHNIEGPGTSDNTSIGIFFDSHSNISVKNGSITGFYYGILGISTYDNFEIDDEKTTSEITIENIILDRIFYRGIRIAAAKTTIKNCYISSTGGSTVSNSPIPMGIEILGPDCSITENWILETNPAGGTESVGICLSEHIDGCKVEGNYLANKESPFPASTYAFWLTTTPANNVVVQNNYAEGYTYPFRYSSTDNSKIITHNIFSRMECSVEDYPEYYEEYPYTYQNQFINEVIGCATDNSETYIPLANEGNMLAMYRLGEIAKSQRDLCQAKAWWQQASDLGHEESTRYLGLYEEKFNDLGCK